MPQRYLFPVTRVDPKTRKVLRFRGSVVLTGELDVDLERPTASNFRILEVKEGFSEVIDSINNTLLGAIKFLSQYRLHPVLKDLPGKIKVRISGISSNEVLVEVSGSEVLLEVSSFKALREYGLQRGLEVLYALALLYSFKILSGIDERRALDDIIFLYDVLKPEHKEALAQVLKSNEVDIYETFYNFLEKGSKASNRMERERWITWAISQVRKDYAYDVAAVRRILDECGERKYTSECARELYQAIKDSYDERLEEENVARLSREARERGEIVVFMRLGRASMILGHLLASAEKIKVTDELKRAVKELEELVKVEGLDELRSSIIMLKSLVSREEVPRAKLERVRKLLIEELQNYRRRVENSIDNRLREGAIDKEVALEEHSKLDGSCRRVRRKIYELEEIVERSPRRSAAFVFFGQRISPTGAARIAYINEVFKAYAGPGYGLEEYIIKGGHNVHATPSLAALKYADYWIEALPLFIYETKDGRYEIDYEDFEVAIRKMAPYWALNIERVEREGGRTPTLNIVTTQSYNMTNLIKYWLEEEMALFNTVRAFGLEGEVRKLVEDYRRRILEYAEEIVREQHLFEALSMELERYRSKDRALISMLYKDPEFAEEVSCLAIVKEFGLENEVERLAEEHMSKGVPRDRAFSNARREVLRSRYIDPSTFKLTTNYSRERVSLYRLAKRYLRDHLDLAESTARKEIIVKYGLLGEVEKYRYEATGPRKKYNLAYTPSRVDLGPGEIASVMDLGQPVGPFDREAGRATKELYELVNVSKEGVYVYVNPAGAEGQKTLENASRDDNYAFANLVALTAEAMGANAYSIIAYINIRPTHLILWPGRGYGGFCIPKDGLFVNFVLSLKKPDILTKLGVPEHVQPRVIKIVEELMGLRAEFEDKQEWQELVREKLDEYLDQLKSLNVFAGDLEQLTNVIGELEGEGTQWSNSLREVARTLYEIRYVPSRIVNSFMPYFTAAHIYHALELARKRNPKASLPANARVAIQAAYKPGVQDSRMTTEFEVFLALTKSDDRIRRMPWDIVGKLAHKILDPYDVPLEIRVIDPLIDADQWFFDSEITLKRGAERIKEILMEGFEGLSEDDIRSNIERFGARVEEWIVGVDDKGNVIRAGDKPEVLVQLIAEDLEELGLKYRDLMGRAAKYGLRFEEWPEFKGDVSLARLLRNKIRGKIHWLIVYTKGIVRDVEDGVRGLDVLSLGIPHPELVELVYDLPRLSFLMRDGNPNSALALVDGTAGARGLVLDKDMVKEWLALGGAYVAVGIADAIVDYWRGEMEEERRLAKELLDSILNREYAKAQEVLNKIVSLLDEDKFEELRLLKQKFELGVDMSLLKYVDDRYRVLESLLERAYGGLHLKDLDFGTFLALGGRFVLAGEARRFESYDDFEEYVTSLRETFEERLEEAPEHIPQAPLVRKEKPPRKAVDEALEVLLLRRKREKERIEIIIGGSLKGEMKEEWEAVQRRIIRARQLRARVIEDYKQKTTTKSFSEAYQEAKKLLGDPKPYASDEAFAKFLVESMFALEALVREIAGDEKARELRRFVEDNIFKVGGMTVAAYKFLIDHLADLAYYVQGEKDKLELMAMAAELVDTSLALELTSKARSWKEVWTAVATFFDKSLNIHIFDYVPYLYTRASFAKDRGFNDVFTRRELFELMARRYGWLYEYLRNVLVTRTELKLLDREDLEKLLTWGTDCDPKALEEGYIEASSFVFKYARLRDLATLYHDGFFIPEILDNVDPEAIKGEERINVVILYNLGNTTAMTFLRRGPFLHDLDEKGLDINVIMTNFLRKERDPVSGKEVFYVDYGLMYLTEEEYRKAGGSNKILRVIADPKLRKKFEKIGPEGRLVFVRFKRPILACAIFPHFTHPWFLDQTLEKAGVPLNQSRVIDRLTYKKTEMPLMISYYNRQVPGNERILFLDQINILRDKLKNLSPEGRRKIVEKILLEFSKKHPKVIIKTSTESGGRGTIVALIRKENGELNNENIYDELGGIAFYGFRDAVEFILREILPKDDAVIQEFIESNPREILTEEALNEVKRRFERLGIRITEDTPLYWNFRNYVTQVPGEEPQIVGWIMLIHVRAVANYGQGGQLFLFEREMVKPQHRYIFNEMERVSKATMKMLELYAPIFAKREGIEIYRSLAGFSYSFPLTNLSDLMLKPCKTSDGKVEWHIVPIEENIGMGLFYPYERELSKRGRSGESVDPILINLAKVGRKYLEVLGRKGTD